MDEVSVQRFGYPLAERRRTGHSVACANTVMIPVKLTENDASEVWCLGFIEDMRGDEMYISFHCTKLPPRWLPSSKVFPHVICLYYPNDKQVLVALRASATDPLVFEAASLLLACPGTPQYHRDGRVCYVETIAGGCRHLVHELQIAEQRPQRPLSEASGREGRYVKHCLPLPAGLADEAVTRGGGDGGLSMDENRVYYELQRSRHDRQFGNYEITMASGYGNRFFFHGQSNAAVRIICWEQGECFWTPELLTRALHRCVESGALAVAVNPLIQQPQCSNDPDTVATISRLPLEIIAQVVELTDVVTQAKLKRVSPVWNAVLVGSTYDRLLIDFSLRVDSVDCSSDMWRLGQLLYHTLNAGVRTLVLTQWTPGLRVHGHEWSSLKNDVTVVCGLLRVTATAPLRRIILHRCVVDVELGSPEHSRRELRSLSKLMEVCRQLLLVDYTMNNTLQALSNVPSTCTHRCRCRRRHPRPPLSVAVTFLRFDDGQSATAQYDALLAAIVQRLPAPSPDLLRAVTALCSYWSTAEPGTDSGTNSGFLRRLLHLSEPLDPAHPNVSPWAHVGFVPTPVSEFNRLTLVALSALWCIDSDS
ncbi:uncharacterized protein LOC129598158 [Paramacrobiotus metropolitanus]|uniref:uncharacterized protein LOC129598158 n=1 Tax=Paramacrobiotus metropolitanus TaxID=2943436 RepID=UPI0024458908|nr:uncharacterized protein LOC129598158 [Paramacrobiotus metropolitanus]